MLCLLVSPSLTLLYHPLLYKHILEFECHQYFFFVVTYWLSFNFPVRRISKCAFLQASAVSLSLGEKKKTFPGNLKNLHAKNSVFCFNQFIVLLTHFQTNFSCPNAVISYYISQIRKFEVIVDFASYFTCQIQSFTKPY